MSVGEQRSPAGQLQQPLYAANPYVDSRPLHWALRTGQREGLWIAYRLVTMETVRYLPAQALPRGARSSGRAPGAALILRPVRLVRTQCPS